MFSQTEMDKIQGLGHCITKSVRVIEKMAEFDKGKNFIMRKNKT